MAAKKKKATHKLISTVDLIALAKSQPNRWLWAHKTVNKTLEQHWLCWKHSRMYHFMNKEGQPKVVEVALFRIEHDNVQWKVPA